MLCVEAKLNYLINIIRKITKYTEQGGGQWQFGPFAGLCGFPKTFGQL